MLEEKGFLVEEFKKYVVRLYQDRIFRCIFGWEGTGFT